MLPGPSRAGLGGRAQAAGGSDVVAEHRVPLVQKLQRGDLGLHSAGVDGCSTTFPRQRFFSTMGQEGRGGRR